MADQLFSLIRGDSQEITIDLTHGGSAYTPPVGSIQTFTLKRLTEDEDDSAAVQKTNGAGLTIVSTTKAKVELVPQDTYDLRPSTLYLFDVQSMESDGKLKTVAFGSITFRGDITRQPGVSIPIYTLEPAAVQLPPPQADSVLAGNAGGTAWIKLTFAQLWQKFLDNVSLLFPWSRISDKPTFATVATSGVYSDLTGRPTLGTAAAKDVGNQAGNVVALAGLNSLDLGDGTVSARITLQPFDGSPAPIDAVDGGIVIGGTFGGNFGSFTGSFSPYALTGNYTYTLPNASGTLALTSDLGTAAARDVGQAAGNVPELSADNTISLGNATTEEGGVLKLFDNAVLDFSTLTSLDGALQFGSPAGGVFSISGASSGFLLTGQNLTVFRNYILPDASGTLALTAEVKSANFTAANDGEYTITATCTVTDPTPVQGKGYTVFVRNGTATVGGTAYATAGTTIRRVYHSGAWANYTNTGGGGVHVGETAPLSPTEGDRWYDSATGAIYVYYGTQWVETSGSAVPVSIATGVTGLGTGVATALAVNVGSSGAFVTLGGALGTPSSGTLTNCTGYPVATAAQTVAGTSTTLPVPPASLLLTLLNTGLRLLDFSLGTNVTTGSGVASDDGGMSYRLSVTNVTAGTIIRRLRSTSTASMTHVGASQLHWNFGKPWGASARIGFALAAPNAGNATYFCIGKGSSIAYGLTGADKFYFIESIGGTIKAGYWNGSTATRTGTLSTITLSGVTEVILIANGSGSVDVYTDGAFKETLTGGPTDYYSTDRNLTFEAGNDGTGTGVWSMIAQPVKFWSYN